MPQPCRKKCCCSLAPELSDIVRKTTAKSERRKGVQRTGRKRRPSGGPKEARCPAWWEGKKRNLINQYAFIVCREKVEEVPA